MSKQPRRLTAEALAKCPTGIRGLDQITDGGLPCGRSTLVCGGPGAGKTLMGIEFLARGARDFGEAGVFVSFEERADDLAKNAFSLGFDLGRLVRSERFAVEHIALNRAQLLEAGEYDLEGLFIRLGAATDAVGAKRVVLDTIEALFRAWTSHLPTDHHGDAWNHKGHESSPGRRSFPDHPAGGARRRPGRPGHAGTDPATLLSAKSTEP